MTTDGMEARTVEGGLGEPEALEIDQGTLDLAAPEDQHDRVDWEAAAAAVLRKARRMDEDDDDALVWDLLSRRTLDGISVTPLGTPELIEGLVTAGRPERTGDWDIRSHLAEEGPRPMNELARTDLDGGVTSLWLEVGSETDFGTLLDGVLLDLAPVVIGGDGDAATARAFLKSVAGRELHPGTNLGLDSSAVQDSDLAELTKIALDEGILAVVVDATEVHAAGASDAQELGWSMARGATALRTLTAAGVPLDDSARLIEFRYAVTDDQFTSIAKLRAARRLWARILELSDATAVQQRQHAVTSRAMMSKYDPWVNMLRTTVAAFAAGVGGADAVTVLPFDTPLGQPDVLARRIARNTSALLIAESHTARVADPAGGSYAVEKLTDDLAIAAWEELGRIEAEGDQAHEDRIAQVVAAREEQIATRKRPLTGLTEFPNLAETLPVREPASGAAQVRRYGASFEALRDDPPETAVFLATMGPIAQHTARASFAINLFAAGGIAVDVAGATDGAEALVAAYDGQPVVCLAGSDAAYSQWGVAAMQALREAGATHVIIAGKPDVLAGGGVDDSCAMGIDALAFLTRTREVLG